MCHTYVKPLTSSIYSCSQFRSGSLSYFVFYRRFLTNCHIAIYHACRWLSLNTLLALGRRGHRSLWGVLQPDGPRCTVNEQVRQLIRELGCIRPIRGKWGKRAGLHNQAKRSRHHMMNMVTSSVIITADPEEIPTVIGNRYVDKQPGRRREHRGQCGSSDCRCPVLSVVPKAEILTPSFKVGVFNAHSVANKSASVCHWIAHNDLHIAAVVETWHDGNESPSLVACTPPGYRYIERARSLLDDPHPLNTNHCGEEICTYVLSQCRSTMRLSIWVLHLRFRYKFIDHCLIPSRLSYHHWSILWIIHRSTRTYSVI